MKTSELRGLYCKYESKRSGGGNEGGGAFNTQCVWACGEDAVCICLCCYCNRSGPENQTANKAQFKNFCGRGASTRFEGQIMFGGDADGDGGMPKCCPL